MLPSELLAQITRRVQAGEEVRPRHKAKQDKQSNRGKGVAPVVAAPSPDLLEIPAEVFVHEGKPLPQIALAQLGPSTDGVALSTG